MRIKHSEQGEFTARFYCAANPTEKHNVPVEIETASGDLAATTFVSEEVSVKAADWLRHYRTARELEALRAMAPVEILPAVYSQPAAASPFPGPVAWTFESHRRDCPACGRRIMKAATRCGYCWTDLDPVHESMEMRLIDEGPVYSAEASLATGGRRRACPTCGSSIMENAALCGYCWSRSGL